MNDEEEFPLARVTDEEKAEAEQIADIAHMESPEEFEAALKDELTPAGAELTDEKAQHISDLDVIYANLRAHRENLSKLKTLAILSKAGVKDLPHLNTIKTDIKGQRTAINSLVELANDLRDDPEAVIPEPSDLEVVTK